MYTRVARPIIQDGPNALLNHTKTVHASPLTLSIKLFDLLYQNAMGVNPPSTTQITTVYVRELHRAWPFSRGLRRTQHRPALRFPQRRRPPSLAGCCFAPLFPHNFRQSTCRTRAFSHMGRITGEAILTARLRKQGQFGTTDSLVFVSRSDATHSFLAR